MVDDSIIKTNKSSSKSAKVSNDLGFKLDTEVFYSTTDSKKVIIVSTAFGAHLDYNPIYRLFAQKASENGYNVILYSFTGMGDSEGKFRNTTLQTKTNDLSRVIEFAREEIPHARICLLGHSLGASISIAAFAEDKKTRGAQDIYAIISWNSSLSTQGLYDRYLQHYSDIENVIYTHERPLTNSKIISGKNMWKSFKTDDPARKIHLIDVPILLLFGSDDDLIKTKNVKPLLDSARIKYDCEIISHCDHEFMNDKNCDDAINKTLDWLKEHFR
jgi:alpha-beta hydrolase superfamily lysophospholipase